MPPTVVLSEKFTGCELPSGFPPVSTSLKITVDVSCRFVPPVPFKVIFVGDAERNWIDPGVGTAILRVDDEVAKPLTDAVTVSFPPQPLSRYEAVATPPALVATLVVRTALPLLAHGELKVTVCGDVTGVPALLTVTLTLVVPNADSGLAPKVKPVMLTLAAPMAKPSEPLTAVPAT